MEESLKTIVEWLLAQGPIGFVALVGFGLYFYERKLHAKERQDHINTLKLVTPLAQKFTDTMDVVLPLALAQINRRDQ